MEEQANPSATPAASPPAKRGYSRPTLNEFGKVHLSTGGQSFSGRPDGSNQKARSH